MSHEGRVRLEGSSGGLCLSLGVWGGRTGALYHPCLWLLAGQSSRWLLDAHKPQAVADCGVRSGGDCPFCQ